MKDKLFWICLIIAGIFIYNKMTKSTGANQNTEDYIDDRRVPDGNTKSVDAGEYGQLNLPNKENNNTTTSNNQNNGNTIDAGKYGDIKISKSDNGTTNNQSNSPIDIERNTSGSTIDAGKYGEIKLPGKDNNVTNSETKNTGEMNVRLHPNTSQGGGNFMAQNEIYRAILDGQVMQISNSIGSIIYIDKGGYCNASSVQNCSFYVA